MDGTSLCALDGRFAGGFTAFCDSVAGSMRFLERSLTCGIDALTASVAPQFDGRPHVGVPVEPVILFAPTEHPNLGFTVSLWRRIYDHGPWPARIGTKLAHAAQSWQIGGRNLAGYVDNP